jgi:hypothetical protein
MVNDIIWKNIHWFLKYIQRMVWLSVIMTMWSALKYEKVVKHR